MNLRWLRLSIARGLFSFHGRECLLLWAIFARGEAEAWGAQKRTAWGGSLRLASNRALAPQTEVAYRPGGGGLAPDAPFCEDGENLGVGFSGIRKGTAGAVP